MYATTTGTCLKAAGSPQQSQADARPTPNVSAGDDPGRQASLAVSRDLELEHAPRSVGQARHLAQEFLGRTRTDAAEAVIMVVSELVTNAIEHAQPPVMLHLHREMAGNSVWIGVTDGGPSPHEGDWTSSCTDQEHGRGLNIVEALAEAHGTRSLAGNTTTHWARLHAA
ncbi:ATP-binding protein [Streptomyces sp. NPDC005529]|uniref:ATP-binding protein n=1 Tax=unclassified Streptomyces TaxID=2593676 RepID=UPI0033A48A63